MRSACMHLLLTLAVLAICCAYATGYKISDYTSSLSDGRDTHEDSLERSKRQIESFDIDPYPSASSQGEEEPSFWDRVVKVALRLFSRFVEWLNS